ncbi:hypothetical protein HMN09_00180500 [Mycena chlorophos]|uniref:VIT-domain-containing protein n=1 Tax=Mycena chlorophos TaxID=658473 RepID=A0A8H6TL96_MYCCL|nr:hypothetical protein HMN09_00180500 [Mycena chlorophos]
MEAWGLYYFPVGRGLVSIPLLSVSVAATIKDLTAQVKITQTFAHEYEPAEAVDATYSLPIPARAAVCSFVLKQEDRKVVGHVEGKKEAKEKYDEAVSQGKTAALLEQTTPDVFKVAVGNIKPKALVVVELIYATPLSEDEENDSWRFHLPTRIGARYGEAPTFDLRPYFSTWSSLPQFLDIKTSIETVAPIAKIGCPSHTVNTELGPDSALPNAAELPFAHYARVSLTSESALDKDFVLTLKSAGVDAPRCVAELHPNQPTVALSLSLVPRFTLPDIPRQEFVFLVDRSGSMEGDRISAARKALVVMLRSLPAADTLTQIASFGNNCTFLWKSGSRAYNRETLDAATQYVDRLRADMGGTEIRGALAKVFKARQTNRPTSVIVLTDGEAWDLDGVLDEVKSAVGTASQDAELRVSVLGIGNSVSTAMCQGIARVGNGTCQLVGDNETSFAGKIARMLKAARMPLISDVTVDWGVALPAVEEEDFEVVEKEVEEPQKDKEVVPLNIFDASIEPMQVDNQMGPPPPSVVLPSVPHIQRSPFKIHTISSGTRLSIHAIIQEKVVPEIVTLKGKTAAGAEIRLPVKVALSSLPNEPDAPPAVHALAARNVIQDLEDGKHAIQIADEDLRQRTVNACIVRLGKTYSIASSQTSFVAVDEASAGQLPQRPIPVFAVQQSGLASGYRRRMPGFRGGGRGGVRSGRSGRGTAAIAGTFGAAGGSRGSRGDGLGGLKRKAMNEDDQQAKILALEARMSMLGGSAASVPAGSGDIGEMGSSERERERESAPKEFRKTTSNTTPLDAVEELIRLRSFDGSFALHVLALINFTVPVEQARLTLPAEISDTVAATVFAAAYLSTQIGLKVERDVWEAVYDKARAFIDIAAMSQGRSVDELLVSATGVLA